MRRSKHIKHMLCGYTRSTACGSSDCGRTVEASTPETSSPSSSRSKARSAGSPRTTHRSTTKVLGDITPHEKLTEQKPNLAGVPEWGQRVWVHRGDGSKLEVHAWPAR